MQPGFISITFLAACTVPAHSRLIVLGWLIVRDYDLGAGSLVGRCSQEARVREEKKAIEGSICKVVTVGHGTFTPPTSLKSIWHASQSCLPEGQEAGACLPCTLWPLA